MTATNYPKDINATNFLNGSVDAGRLTQDIEQYTDTEGLSITIVLEAVEITETVCNLWFKDGLTTEEQTMLTAVCLAHTGVPLPSEVTAVTLEPTGSSLKDLQIVLVDMEADLNTSTEKYISFSEIRYIQGVTIELINHTPGINKDQVGIEIVAPNGVGGWVVARSLVKGESNYAPVPPSGTSTIIAEGTAEMPTYLQIKLTYVSTNTTGEKPYVHLSLRTWL
ncbi:MAG: hypothetical protein DRP01_08420 [Archaeoglobales archaeon]|nr:MAG: hypothetical protein DRP01_08420 [Archaeoglobales archaeon]